MPGTLRLYYDDAAQLFQVGRGSLRVSPLELRPGDLSELQLQVVRNGFARFKSDGTAADVDTLDISLVAANWIFGFKTEQAFRAGDDFAFSQSGFNVDSPWHNPSKGRLAMPFVVSADAVALGRYLAGIIFVDAFANRNQLGTMLLPIRVIQPLMTADESVATPATVPGLHDDFSIAGTATEVIIPIANLTPTGRCAIGQLPPTGDIGSTIFKEDYSTPGQLRIFVDAAPGDGGAFNGHWTLLNLS
jgi:hypothetical protein